MAVQEDLHDDRNAFYYARELYYHRQYEEAIVQFKRHLALPTATWAPERAASYRFLSKCDPANKEQWLTEAIKTAPGSREPYVDLAQHYYEIAAWPQCLAVAESALQITEKPLEYLCEAEAWGWKPYDLAAIAAHRLNMHIKALEYGRTACALEPSDERLAKNLAFYEAASLA
jgi:tetratricopeptide (TPR) repeat protein